MKSEEQTDSVRVHHPFVAAILRGSFAALAMLCVARCASMPQSTGLSRREAIFVTNTGGPYVTVYDLNANGDAEPIATIETALWDRMITLTSRAGGGLDDPAGIAVNAEGDLYVANFGGGWLGHGSIGIFRHRESGATMSAGRIAGPNTNLVTTLAIAADAKGSAYVARQRSLNPDFPPGINIYAPDADGDVAPAEEIAGPHTGFESVKSVAVDSNGNVFVAASRPNLDGDAVLMFGVGRRGDTSPTSVIAGPRTQLGSIVAIAVDPSAKVYVASRIYQGPLAQTHQIEVFETKNEGNAAPLSLIAGPHTGLSDLNYRVFGIAADSTGNLYVAGGTGTSERRDKVLVFDSIASGDIQPRAVIEGPHTRLKGAYGIAIGPYH
jgi:hypothetical protein